MHPRTEATLEQLRQAHWFSRVGVHDAKVARVLSSWREAIEHCTSPDWEDLCQEAVNQYSERLIERSPERYRHWNAVVEMVRPVARALVNEKTRDVVERYRLPKGFVDTVRWDIIHLLMEAEYADVYPPGFFASQAYWYVKGHFPCGWDGVFPQGLLIIY